MKRIILVALAAAALSLGSCQKNEVVLENPNLNAAIEFTTYTGKAPVTKAGILSNANFDEFGVTAFYTGGTSWDTDGEGTYWNSQPNFMYNQLVERDRLDNVTWGAWKYSPIKYWPNQTTDKLSFFAYAPYSVDNDYVSISSNAISGSPKVTVTIPTLTDEVEDPAAVMVDFVADVQIDVQHGVNTDDANENEDKGNRGPVEFEMLHEMTRLAITAQLDETLVTENDQKSTVVIKKIQFGTTNDLFYYPQGVYNFANTNDSEETKVRGTWTYDNIAKQEFILNDYLSFASGQTYCAGTGENAPAGKTYEGKTFGLTTAAKVNLMTGAEYNKAGDNAFLFLLPPYGETGLGAAQDILVEYDIVTKDAALHDGYSCTSASKIVKMPAGYLKQGVAYTINFKFYVDQIELSASVEDWTEIDDKDVNVPYYPDGTPTPAV